MTDEADASQPQKTGFLAPDPDAKQVDHCVRCGREVPVGQGLCEEHNPHHLKGPSPTQMHATIFGGIIIGVIAFFLLARLLVGTTGPYETEITTAAAVPNGGISLTYAVTNEGDENGIADCRITRDGVPRPDDFAFRTVMLTGGSTTAFERTLEAPPIDGAAYDPEGLTVVCT